MGIVNKILRKVIKPAEPKLSTLDILKQRGLKVGSNFFLGQNCVIDTSHCWHITIGNNVIFAANVHVLAHDSVMHRYIGYGNVYNTTIGDDVTLGTGTIVLPGVTIGNRVMVGAGAVVTKDIPENSVAVGNPAKVIGTFDAYIEKHKAGVKNKPKFDESYLLENGLTDEMKAEMIAACREHGSIYLK